MAKKKGKKSVRSARAASASAPASSSGSPIVGDVIIKVPSSEPATRNSELAIKLLDFLNPLSIQRIDWVPDQVAWRATLG
ncbi:MAG TPA: hypothetical protein VMT52_02210 [Planctomycetota bacterium]|nr:hypothetical protein [Planctomycetota bacterium]